MVQVLENKPRLVIVGNGMATGRLLDEIVKREPTKFTISVVGDEPEGSYNRIMLSPVLAGETERNSIIHKDPSWFSSAGIRFVAGRRGTKILCNRNRLLLDNGEHLDYDHLIIATGSRPARIPAANQQLNNIYAFRTLVDVDTILAASSKARTALVVGGGLLGLEAAYGLAQKGLQVTLVHRSGWPLNRQLDATAGGMLREVMEAKNIQFELNAEVSGFVGEHKLQAAQLNNGRTINCDIAVIATGITPNSELGSDSGLECGRGIQVDAHLTSSVSNISAIGECCEFEGETFGLVEPIWHQCVTLADWLCLAKSTPFNNPQVATKLKVSGVQLYSAGEFITRAEHREIVHCDPQHRVYRKLLMNNNSLCGVVLFGDTRDGAEYFDLLQKQHNLPHSLAAITLGKSFQSLALVKQQPQAVVNQ